MSTISRYSKNSSEFFNSRLSAKMYAAKFILIGFINLSYRINSKKFRTRKYSMLVSEWLVYYLGNYNVNLGIEVIWYYANNNNIKYLMRKKYFLDEGN